MNKIMQILHKIIDYILPFIHIKKIKQTHNKISSALKRKETEMMGCWYFKKDLLDYLDEYLICMRRIKKTDPIGYRMYSKIGAFVIPNSTGHYDGLIGRWKNPKFRPSFGAVTVLGYNKAPENLLDFKLGYFRKLKKSPIGVEPTKNQVYMVTLFHTNLDDQSNWGRLSHCFYISLDEKTNIQPLKTKMVTYQEIKHKDSYGGYSSLRKEKWDFDLYLKYDSDDKKCDEKERAAFAFHMIASVYEQIGSSLRISATKNNITATFSIDLLRTPYFFDEREPVYNEKGAKRRIFHIVRTHERHYENGKVIYVKSHLKGLRKFIWKGFYINITMPDTHHPDLLDLTASAEILSADNPKKLGQIYEDEMSDIIKSVTNS